MEKREITEAQLLQMVQKAESNLTSLNRNLERLKQGQRELEITVNSLEEAKTGKEVKVSLGSGVLVNAELKVKGKCERSVAENYFIEEKITETIKKMKKRKEIVGKRLIETTKRITTSRGEYEKLISIVQKLNVEKQKRNGK